MNNEIIQGYLTRLGNAFRAVCEGKQNPEDLYVLGEDINSSLCDDISSGRISEDEELGLLEFAIDTAHQLHNGNTRTYLREHRDDMEEYAKMLLGEKEAKIPFGSDPIDEQK